MRAVSRVRGWLFLHGGSTSCPVFMLETVHVAHIKSVQPHEISTGDLLTSLCTVITDQDILWTGLLSV